ncbi:conjugal transfer protein [Staphylococcus aureus]|uniref:conjugal transfer protein n=1 Tax=Staphylococcus aureus TaxID=1280 RepID=UPI0005C7C472|nr:conjugal transfer protein [Staphylococcus aureus]HDH6082999.1 conjugal transfer protein [Staphylococcus aureus]
MIFIKTFLTNIRKIFLNIINKLILSRFVKKGKSFDVPEEERKELPKYRNHRKKIIILFYTFLIFLALLLIVSFVRASKADSGSKQAVNKVDEIQQKYEDNAETVQYNPNLKLYADKFIDTYMTIPKDGKDKEARQKALAGFYPSDYKTPAENTENVERKLNDKEFFNIKRKDKQTIIQYIVNYDLKITEKKEVKVKKKKKNKKDKAEYETKTEEKERTENKRALLNIPIKSENNKYVVVEYPHFSIVPNNQLKQATLVKDSLENEKREDNPKLKAFVEEFFEKYAKNKADDMAYLMDNPEGLEDTREVSRINDLRIYPKADSYIVKAEVLMRDKNSPLENLEHYTLEIIKKDDKYFVKKLTNTIGG